MVGIGYGFKLGQIEGLSSSVEKVNLTLAGETSSSYILTYIEADNIWNDNDDNPSVVLFYHPVLEEYVIYVINMDESDVGDEYTINLSTPETPSQSFVNALQMVGSAFRIEVKFSEEAPDGYLDISAGDLYEMAKKSMVFYALEVVESGFVELDCAFLKYAEINTPGETSLYSFSFSNDLVFAAEGADAYPVIQEG